MTGTARDVAERIAGRPAERFVHYSAKPLKRIRSVKQTSQPDMKPRGLWFSVDDPSLDEPMGWREWCEAENVAVTSLKLQTELAFASDARIVRLSSAPDIDCFHRQYSEDLLPGYRQINWARVAKDFQAVIIAPYIWERRLDREARWYYSWDCASGCVWDATAIRALSPQEGAVMTRYVAAVIRALPEPKTK